MPQVSLSKYAVALCALIVLACPGAAHSQAEFGQGQEDLFQSTLEQGVAQCRVPGAVAAVRSPEGALWKGAAGLADIEHALPMRTDLHFHVGSLTKSFTATLFLELCDRGLASLDDTVEKWLPGLLARGDQITVRDLLQMRSGLESYGNIQAFRDKFLSRPRYQWLPRELAAMCGRQVFPVGSRFDYNNVNYFLVGMIIEKALNQPYHEAVQEYILDPLGMVHSSVPTGSGMPEPFAKGYLYQNGFVSDVSTLWDPSPFWAAGSMISSLDDMLIWADALMEGSLLSAASHAQQFTFVPIESDPHRAYGMGVGIDRGMMGHSGNYNALYTATLYRLNGHDLVILCNGQSRGGDEGSTASCLLSRFRTVLEDMPR